LYLVGRACEIYQQVVHPTPCCPQQSGSGSRENVGQLKVTKKNISARLV